MCIDMVSFSHTRPLRLLCLSNEALCRRRRRNRNWDFPASIAHNEKAGVGKPAPAPSMNRVLLVVVREVEQVEEIADGRTVDRYIGIAIGSNRVGEVVAAAVCDGLHAPVPLDELQDRNMVGVVM